MNALLSWTSNNVALISTPVGALVGVLFGRRGKLPSPVATAITHWCTQPIQHVIERREQRHKQPLASEGKRRNAIRSAIELAAMTLQARQEADLPGCSNCTAPKSWEELDWASEHAAKLLNKLRAQLTETLQYEKMPRAVLTFPHEPSEDDFVNLQEHLAALLKTR
ncbi:hypothetical protein [Streptomyces olivaceus]|uniref:hypothetical protein n=1 Tax=Streptomyces olivaceus TaxID=47716 RepID=UPI001CCAE66B|nr:hypothetical protein [Streptomyces olivaceus]MBZ6132115.1 hypothetical protein [Streptomyces olivaceus]